MKRWIEFVRTVNNFRTSFTKWDKKEKGKGIKLCNFLLFYTFKWKMFFLFLSNWICKISGCFLALKNSFLHCTSTNTFWNIFWVNKFLLFMAPSRLKILAVSRMRILECFTSFCLLYLFALHRTDIPKVILVKHEVRKSRG